jgi:hypothetical protein
MELLSQSQASEGQELALDMQVLWPGSADTTGLRGHPQLALATVMTM